MVAAFWPFDSPFRVVPAARRDGKRSLFSTVLVIAFVAGALRQSVRAVRIARSTLSASSRRQRQAPSPVSTGVLFAERRGLGVGRVWFFDIQGWITLILGGLLALITLFTSYSHVHLPFLGSIALNQQIGVLLLLALVPPLIGVDEVFSEGVAELATRCRLRAERDRVRAERARVRAEEDRARAADEAAEERDLADRERERAARRAQRQVEYNLVQIRHQLDPTEANAQRVRDVISLLEEVGGFA